MTFNRNQVLLQFHGFLETPAMWTGKGYFTFPQFFPNRITEAKNSQKIPVVPNNIALGRRMEHFFEFYIENFAEAEILAANEQVISNKVTLGELDFLLKDLKTEKTIHVELVYKFYIYDPSFEIEKDRWIGPNRRDTLVKKLEKLEHRQFPLLFKTETMPMLDNLQVSTEKIEQEICFKALLFLPKHFQNQKIPDINQDCIAGFWIKLSEFTSGAFKNHQFHVPEKQNWPIAPKFCQKWYGFEEIIEEVLLIFQNKKSPLIWMKKNEQEYERFFVVWW